jgi:hypothetical protein
MLTILLVFISLTTLPLASGKIDFICKTGKILTSKENFNLWLSQRSEGKKFLIVSVVGSRSKRKDEFVNNIFGANFNYGIKEQQGIGDESDKNETVEVRRHYASTFAIYIIILE